MRMLRRGLNSPPFFEASSLRAFRLKSRFGLDRSLAENISDTPRGVDEFGIPGIALYLLAEVADMDVHRAFVAELVAPHPAQKRAAREHPAWAGGQGHQEFELGVGEVHLFTVGRHPATWQVDPEPVVGQFVGTLARRYRGPAHDRPDARHQLPAGELVEHDVEHNQVRLERLERFQSGLAVTSDLDLEPLALEGMREHLLERRLVVDQKYLARHTL